VNNQQVADILRYVADCLEIQGELIYKVLAYRKVADHIAALPNDIAQVWQAGQLRSIPGVGKAIAEKLDSLLSTGTFDLYERVKTEVPAGVIEMLHVPDVGPKKARLFWQELGTSSVAELHQAALAGRLRSLPGMGEKSEAKILAGVEAYLRRAANSRLPLGEAYGLACAILDELHGVPGVQRAAVAGSLRRWRETIGDLDFLVAADPSGTTAEAVMERFVKLSPVAEILLRGATKTSVRLDNGIQADMRVVEAARWGTALQYFSGSQAHNVRLREIAQKKGYSLSEYALTHVASGQEITCAEEAEVYKHLGLPYIPPELREDRGEFEAELPRLVEMADIQGDLHMHSTWSDGKGSIADMAAAASQRGLRYIAITDHSQSMAIAGGLSAQRLRQQRAEVDAANRSTGNGFRVLHGIEVEIRADGRLDFADEVLAELDIVVASLHTGLHQGRERTTQRMLAAIHNPHVDIIAHPSGRLLGEREGADLDYEAILHAAAETRTIMEINANPARLDLDDIHARRAIELGCVLAVSSDAHNPDALDLMPFGVATARRAWATAESVANTWSLDSLLAWIEAR
jgi:DNA polymerase (family 10)